jgi:hypothetical protein
VTLFRNTAEGGTNTAGVTNGNSGGVSGTALRTNITGSGSTLTYTTVAGQFSQGLVGFKHDWAAGGQAALRLPTGVSSTNWAQSFDFSLVNIGATGSQELLDVWNVGSDHVFKLFINPDGTIRGRMRNAVSNTAALQSSVGATPLVTGTWYRLDYVVVPGAGTADGTIKWRICLQGSNTPLTGMNVSSAVMDAGTTAIVDAYWGAPENHALAGTMYTDDVRWETAGAATFLGAYVAPSNLPPTLAAITKVAITQGQTVSGTMVATDTDGTIAARQWTATLWPVASATPILTNATTATFTSSALTIPGIYEFTALAQDNGGLWSDPVVFRVGVVAADGTAGVRGIRSNPGGYSGTAADLNDTSSGTGVSSPNSPSGAVVHYDMDPAPATDISFDWVQADLDPDGTGASGQLILEVITGVAGTSVIATRTFTITDASINYPFALSPSENTAFTDRIDWSVRETTTQL